MIHKAPPRKSHAGSQVERYETNGYVLLRDQFSNDEMAQPDEALRANPPLDGNTTDTTYPEPNRYALAKSSWRDPASFTSRPTR
ncbi:MAG: hypothetical protein U5O39_10210 [Gammaproteobacteria bacterium]|nr:hypothetical protein [Gammaproteobacteria bacterium]